MADFKNYKPFNSSLGQDELSALQASAEQFGAPFKIKNPGLFKPKTKRMLFTSLKATEVTATDGSLEERVYSLPDIEMYIDPTNINVKKKVLSQKILTKGGWVLQFWGHDLTMLTVRATSGYYGVTKGSKPFAFTGEAIKTNMRQTLYKDPLKVFEKIKENAYNRRFDGDLPYRGKPVITLIYEGISYRGYFDSFDYSLNSETPHIIQYGFNFNIIPSDPYIQQISKEDIPGIAAETFTNPSGTISKFSTAAISAGEKKAQDGINDLTKKIGIQDYVDLTPSRVVLA
jgi:hypothetical protein